MYCGSCCCAGLACRAVNKHYKALTHGAIKVRGALGALEVGHAVGVDGGCSQQRGTRGTGRVQTSSPAVGRQRNIRETHSSSLPQAC